MGAVINTNPDPLMYVEIENYETYCSKDFTNDYLYFILYYESNMSFFLYWELVQDGIELTATDTEIEVIYRTGDAYTYTSIGWGGGSFWYNFQSGGVPYRMVYDRVNNVLTMYDDQGNVTGTISDAVGLATNAYAVEPLNSWHMTPNGLVNPQFPPWAEVMSEPLPYQYWRIEALAHNGRPFHDLLPGVERINPTPVDERPPEDYICVFDMLTKQNEFTGHGLAVLCPKLCEITEELNGAYKLIMEHPKDPDGKWEYLLEWNIIYARGQLFIIQERKDNWRQGKSSVTVWADHITYQLNDDWIFPGATINPGDPPNGTSLLYGIMFSANAGIDKSQMTYYEFTAASDVEIPAEFHDWDTTDSGATPYAMILGSNGFISKFGGELYRDNFYFSINKRMENADDNAFELRVGKNMIGINKTVDISTACFYFRGYDQDGNWYAVSWAERDWLRGFPRTIVRSQTFTIPDTIQGQDRWDLLVRYVHNYFGQYCAPLISYEITVKDLKKNPEFSMFQNIDRLKVGDKGKVWDVDFSGYLNIEITKTVTNAITGEVTEVTFGSTRSFTRPYGYNPIPNEMFTPVPVEGEAQLCDSEGYDLLDSEGYELKEHLHYIQEE